jgi:hypothetical protein
MLKDFCLLVACVASLAAWALWKTVQVKTLRVAGHAAKADEVQAAADTAMRQLWPPSFLISR